MNRLFVFALISLTWVSSVFAQSLTLTWQDMSNNESAFIVDRKLAGEPIFSELVILPLNSEMYVDTSPPVGVLATYRVKARNAEGDSAYSNEASGTAIILLPPNPPQSLQCLITNNPIPPADPTLVMALGLNTGLGSIAINSAPTGENGAIVGAAWTTEAQFGQALDFDGVNDRVELGDFSVSGSALTLMAWVRSEDLGNCAGNNDCRIITRATGTAEQDHDFMLSTILDSPGTVLRFRLKTNGNTTTLYASSGPLSVDAWHHVAAVYDGAAMRLYLDGVDVGSQGKTGALTVSNGVETWIGSSPPNGQLPWRGQIDEVQVYERALTATEIQTAMTMEVQ